MKKWHPHDKKTNQQRVTQYLIVLKQKSHTLKSCNQIAIRKHHTTTKSCATTVPPAIAENKAIAVKHAAFSQCMVTEIAINEYFSNTQSNSKHIQF